jgi:hypothetical protein
VVVIQSRYTVGELAGVALIGALTALEVALIAIGTIELLALDATCTEAQHHAAQRVGQIIRRARAAAPADQVAGDAAVVALAPLPEDVRSSKSTGHTRSEASGVSTTSRSRSPLPPYPGSSPPTLASVNLSLSLRESETRTSICVTCPSNGSQRQDRWPREAVKIASW